MDERISEDDNLCSIGKALTGPKLATYWPVLGWRLSNHLRYLGWLALRFSHQGWESNRSLSLNSLAPSIMIKAVGYL